MRIVFMGTPDFAVPTLNTLLQSKHQVVAVVTQPDKPKGRDGKIQSPPVKEEAMLHNILVYQPKKVREACFIEKLSELNPDVIVVIAFGQILSKEVLSLPRYGCINIHASLLPKLRGAAPIQWAVIHGESMSGITVMQMDTGIDTGDMLLKEEIVLEKKETGGSLFEKLSQMGGSMLLKVLEQLEEGTAVAEKQDESLMTYAKKLNKTIGKLDFSKPANELECLIRGLNPWPSAYVYRNGNMLKIWDADVVDADEEIKEGTVIRASGNELIIKAKKKALSIKSIQPAGKKRMEVDAFLRGHTIEEGTLWQ